MNRYRDQPGRRATCGAVTVRDDPIPERMTPYAAGRLSADRCIMKAWPI